MVAKKKAKHVAKQMRRAKARAAPAKPKKAAKPSFLKNLPSSVQKAASLYYPKPGEGAGRVMMEPPDIPPHAAPIDITPSREMKATGKKKPLPYIATAVGASAVLSGALAAFFYYVVNLDWLFSLLLALTCFIGLSILFYEFLELAERTGMQ